MYKVTVPVRARRIEEINWTFEVETKKEAEELVSYVKECGLVGLDLNYEEVVEICEEDVLETYTSDVEIEDLNEGKGIDEILKKIRKLEAKKEELEKELERVKAKKLGFKYKVILPYKSEATVNGNYLIYAKNKKEVEEIKQALSKGEILLSKFDLYLESEHIEDNSNEDFIYSNATVEYLLEGDENDN